MLGTDLRVDLEGDVQPHLAPFTAKQNLAQRSYSTLGLESRSRAGGDADSVPTAKNPS